MAVRLETTKSRRNPQLRTSCSWKRHWIVRFCLHELPNEIPEQILTRGEYLVSFPRGGEADFVPIRWLTIAFTRIPSRSRGIPASVSSPVHFTIGICSTSSAESGYLRFTGREQNSLVNSSHHAGPALLSASHRLTPSHLFQGNGTQKLCSFQASGPTRSEQYGWDIPSLLLLHDKFSINFNYSFIYFDLRYLFIFLISKIMYFYIYVSFRLFRERINE